MERNKTRTLLDELAVCMGCNYLSDLRGYAGTERLKACIDKLGEGKYPLTEWREAVEYLKGQKQPVLDEAEARERLKE